MINALIRYDENVQNTGVVENIISMADNTMTLQLEDGFTLWDCSNQEVSIGDRWVDGVFYDASTNEAKPLKESDSNKISRLQAENDALSLLLAQGLGETVSEIDLEKANETVLVKVKDKLTSLPVAGEEWREDANYITGDIVIRNTVEYTAKKYSKNKDPETNPNHWEVKVAEEILPTWESLPEAIIEKGAKCIHDGQVWICSKQHMKSVLYEPEAGSKQWEAQ